MRFAIRDDDTSFFTRPEELDRLWGEFLPYIPISLAVVPVSLEPFHLGDIGQYYQSTEQHPLGENPDLVSWIRSHIADGSVAVSANGIFVDAPKILGTSAAFSLISDQT